MNYNLTQIMAFENLIFTGDLDKFGIRIVYHSPQVKKLDDGGVSTTSIPITATEFFTNLQPDQFSTATVGTSKGKAVIPKVRSGQIYEDSSADDYNKRNSISVDSFDDFSKYAYEHKKYISGYKLANMPFIHPVFTQYIGYTGKFLKYDTGDHFDTFHYDSFSNPCEQGTLLLFPPNTINKFTGGMLVFKNDAGDEHIIDPSKFTTWTGVAFGKILHKCTPVLSGTRYVLKYTINAIIPGISEDVHFNYLMKDTIHELISKYNRGNIETTIKTSITFLKSEIKELLTAKHQLEHKYFDTVLTHLQTGAVTYECNPLNPDDESKYPSSYYLVRNFINTETEHTYTNNDLEVITKKIDLKLLDFQFFTHKLQLLLSENLTISSDMIIESVRESSNPVIYYTGTHYSSPDEYSLELLNMINVLIDNGLKIVPIQLEAYSSIESKSDGYYEPQEPKISHSMKYCIWHKERELTTGCISNKLSEYNDETYDNVIIYKISCFLIYSA